MRVPPHIVSVWLSTSYVDIATHRVDPTAAATAWVVGKQVLLAEMLLSGEGDTILGMQSLAGAVGMAAFTYFLPFIMHYIFFYEEVSRLRAVYYAVNGVIGMAIMIGGVYASVHELAGSATGFFDGKCRLEYSYAPTSPDDPCYISGIPELARQ
jgi:hypothetical protein